MKHDQTTNLAASIKQRLLNKARNEGRPFNELLQYYAMERALYRLGQSPWKSKFILKGGLLFRIWELSDARPTMDIDVLGKITNNPETLKPIIKEILSTTVEPDGLEFYSNSIHTRSISEQAEYNGIEVKFIATLGAAKINLRLDIGIGDSYFPEIEKHKIPGLLDLPTGEILCYPPESVIAEKLETMIKLGALNSRMKDFYDIYLLLKTNDFDKTVLSESIRQTFSKRETQIKEPILIFKKSFINEKQPQWRAFQRKMNMPMIPESFEQVIHDIERFIKPTLDSNCEHSIWKAGTGWS